MNIAQGYPVVHDPRSAHILDSVKDVFAAKGFDGASMQDLARAAGMSAGNFYRYFPSKEAIIAAMVARDLEVVRAEFNSILRSERPSDTFKDLIRSRIEFLDHDKHVMFAEIAASAERRPEVAQMMNQFEAEILGYITASMGLMAGVPPEEASQRFGAHARFIMLLIQGLTMKGCGKLRPMCQQPDRDLADLVMQTIERLLADIVALGPLTQSQKTSV